MPRKVSTKTMDRAEWKMRRSHSIGSSDAPVICGVDPWKTPLELYYEKRGEVPPPELTSNYVLWGVRLEDIVARTFAEQHGLKVRKDNSIRCHKNRYWQTCNLDRTITRVDNRNGTGLLEVKCSSRADEWGPSGTDEVPDRVMIQVQHQYAVTGMEWGYVAALLAGHDDRWYEILPDKLLIEKITDMEAEFWDRVLSGEPPEPVWEHESTPLLLKKLYPGTDGSIVELDGEALAIHLALKEAQDREKEAKGDAAKLKAKLAHLIGEAAMGRLPDGTAWTRKEVERKGYRVKKCKYIDFRHVKNPKV